ncbi:MAG: pyrroline-5-carboxylate reductase [bacterium]
MKKEKRTGFRAGVVGAGKMGAVVLKGLVESGLVKPADVVVYELDAARAKKLARELGVARAASPADLARGCGVIFLCVKPDQFPSAAEEMRGALAPGACVVSIMAGVGTERIRRELGGVRACVRVMPNLACRVRAGVSAVSRDASVPSAVYGLVVRLFEFLGGVVEVPERMMDAVTAVSGSGPAYVFMLVEALADGGVRVGLDRKTAMKLAALTALGAARLMEESGAEPALLRAEVSSPGGTTVEATALLECRGFRSAVIDAVAAARDKARALAER